MKGIPVPPISNRLIGVLTGHLADIMSASKNMGSNSLTMGIFLKRNDWYTSTNSKTCRFRLLGMQMVMCSDPKVFKEILGSKQDHFTSNESVRKTVGFLLPRNIGAVDGQEWQILRKWIQRAINKQSLDPLVKIMDDLAVKIGEISKVNEMETLPILSRVSFDAFFRVLYGWDPQAISESKDSLSLVASAAEFSRALSERILLPIPFLWYLPTPGNRRINEAVLFLNKYAIAMIASRKEARKQGQVEGHQSFLDLMIAAAESDDTRNSITDNVLSDNLAGLFFAAYDTTSATLHVALNHLARAPRVQEKLRECLRARFPALGSDLVHATMADLEQIEYLGHVIDESMRVNSVAPFFIRSCTRDVEICGMDFRRGMQVAIDHASVARNPEFWNGQTDLDHFRPERWAEFTPSRATTGLTFGAGSRICIGRNLALAEIRAFIAAVVCRYRVSLRVPEDSLEVDFGLMLQLRKGTGNLTFERLV
jgi:cytochrome P450